MSRVNPSLEKDATERHYALSDPDVGLMMRVRQDDMAAFEQLVMRYRDRVVAELLRLVHREELAEELAQEAFLRVYNARTQYVARAKFWTWLFTIVKNLALNTKRALSRRREVNVRHCDDVAYPSGWPRIDRPGRLEAASKVEISEVRSFVRDAVENLNNRQRTAIMLKNFHSMSHAEVAAAMNISPQAVKSLLWRARTNLRDMLEPYFAN